MGQVVDVFEGNLIETGRFLMSVHRRYRVPGVHPVIQLGWERFIITTETAKKTQAPWSLEVIGMLRWISYTNNWDILPSAAPGDRDLGKKEWVKALGWLPPRSGKDAMSAAQHLLAFLIRTGRTTQVIRDMIRPSEGST